MGLNREKIRNAINTMTFKTIIGDVRFNGVQNATTPTGFTQVQKGKIEVVWPKSRATAPISDKGAWAN